MSKLEIFEDAVEPIAIVGVTGRFPGADNLPQFWENLRDGVESISAWSDEELESANLATHLRGNEKFVNADGILRNMDKFDASFFNFTPREAEILDPQQRLFLECAWEVMEQAGYDSTQYDGRVGVYAGSGLSSYLIRNLIPNKELYATLGSFQTMLANDKDFLTTRVSYKLNLKGPSVNVNTLCSSSFVAIHMACQSLQNYDCDLAMAGGVSLQVSPNEAFFYQEGGIGAHDGHCRAFDAGANGTVSGSGLGIILLKRYSEAVEDGDTIHAVIRGSAVNNDGEDKISYTAPSVAGQAEVITEALEIGEIDPATVTYIEAHGTGTPLGDPIEITALTRAFRASTDKKQYCAIGSVKTNIGHLVTAGGIASLVKTVLALQNKQIPPSLNFETPNPQIDFANSPFFVNDTLRDWETGGVPRRAGISSFGIGGTNVHIVLEEAPEPIPSDPSQSEAHLLTLSARSAAALEKATDNLIDYLSDDATKPVSLADIAYTLQVGRRTFPHRRVLLCRDREMAISKLRDSETSLQVSKNRPVFFLYPPTNSTIQSSFLSYRHEAIEDAVDACVAILQQQHNATWRQILESNGSASYPFDLSAIQHFVSCYALTKFWEACGVVPETVGGVGIGDYVAAVTAGCMSLEDALSLVWTLAQANQNGNRLSNFQKQLAQMTLHEPTMPYLSSVTGGVLTKAEATDLAYWVRQFESNSPQLSATLLQTPERIVLEVSLDGTMAQALQNHTDKGEQLVVPSVSTQSADKQVVQLLRTAGQLWLTGAQIDWSGLYGEEHRHRVPLPTYPFEHQSYWIDPPNEANNAPVKTAQAEQNGHGKQLTHQAPSMHPRPDLATPYIAPRNPLEESLAKIWQEIVGIEAIGIHDDFFELGGHSLLATRIVSQVRDEHDIELPLTQLFEHPTIAAAAEQMEVERWKAKQIKTNSNGKAEVQEEFVL